MAGKKLTLDRIVDLICLRRCYNSGYSVQEIATHLKRSPRRVRKDLQTTGVYSFRTNDRQADTTGGDLDQEDL